MYCVITEIIAGTISLFVSFRLPKILDMIFGKW